MTKGIELGYQIPWAMSETSGRLTTLKDMTPEQKEVAIRGARTWTATRDHCSRCSKYYDEPSPDCLNRLEHAPERKATMWIDTNDCHERFHQIQRVEGKPVCVHADDSECKESEFHLEAA